MAKGHSRDQKQIQNLSTSLTARLLLLNTTEFLPSLKMNHLIPSKAKTKTKPTKLLSRSSPTHIYFLKHEEARLTFLFPP